MAVPKGYVLEEAPTSIEYTLADQSVQFIFQARANDMNVQILSLMQVNRAMVSADQYQQLRELYKTLLRKHSERIVLKRK